MRWAVTGVLSMISADSIQLFAAPERGLTINRRQSSNSPIAQVEFGLVVLLLWAIARATPGSVFCNPSMTVIPPSLPLVVTPVLVQPTSMRVRSADGQEQGKKECR